ncbi:MAG TPA: sugar ABC transporter permease [Chloroflexia bacterium]|nr:sugar ABC transporter permease [Chloroflexia bacterium]
MARTISFRKRGPARIGGSTLHRQKLLFVFVGLTPILLVYTVTRIWPILRTFSLSLYDSDLARPEANFIGLQNYADLLDDDSFKTAFINTTLFAIGTVIASMILGLGLALILTQFIRRSGLYQLIYFLPFVMPIVPVAIVWRWIYDPSYGLLNFFLSWFGIPKQALLFYPETGLWAIVAMNVWKVVGYNMVILIVGIRNIPLLYSEAAAIDGASRWAILRYITVPLLKPVILFVLVVTTIGAYNVFTSVYVMTQSTTASGNAIKILVGEIVDNGFRYSKMGYASSQAVILFVVVLALTLIQFRVVRSDT